MKHKTMAHQFVHYIPEVLEEGVLYVSVDYATVVHRCCCGCGCEVVTPLSPTDWKLTFDGVSVTLYPSIGNWSLPCQSHYWIDRNDVVPARRWSLNEISEGRAHDRRAKDEYYGEGFGATAPAPAKTDVEEEEAMGSTFLPLTDDQLLQKLKDAGDVMIGSWRNPKTGRFETGLRNPTRGAVLALSAHDDEPAARKAAAELEARLDRLAAERRGLTVRNLMDEAGKKPRH